MVNKCFPFLKVVFLGGGVKNKLRFGNKILITYQARNLKYKKIKGKGDLRL